MTEINTVMIDDDTYILVAMIDDLSEITEDPSEAVVLVLQRPEDKRPDGVKQVFLRQSIPKGSVEPMKPN